MHFKQLLGNTDGKCKHIVDICHVWSLVDLSRTMTALFLFIKAFL